ncbi:MAG: hypothetical protein K2K12_01965 [Clostridia bacterium]|nr:hypothetical protein [Clostridia bacterium]
MAKVVVVKFKGGCKPYYFSPNGLEFKRGQGVIVETTRGLEYATVVIPEKEANEKELVAPLKPIVRIATQADEDTMRCLLYPSPSPRD